ncbi:hypothetical protein ACOMHN_043834 [Nucella lapillus]
MRLRDIGGPALRLAPRLLWLWRLLPLAMVVVVAVPLCGAKPSGGHQILWGRCYSHCIKRHLLHSDDAAASASSSPPAAVSQYCLRLGNMSAIWAVK